MAGPSGQDEWTTKEKFVLACCVARSGDQNWVSVSRTIKLILESGGEAVQRPVEWFSQKSCATRYNALLNTASISKRKSRGGSETINIETPAEQILRKLTFERHEELDKSIKADREKYRKLKSDIEKLKNGKLDDQLPRIWNAIQSGQSLETLIQEAPQDVTPCTIAASNLTTTSKATVGVPATTPASVTASASHTPARPQRAPKETAKFKIYNEQRQKQAAKYQQHHTSTTHESTDTVPTVTAISNASDTLKTSTDSVFTKGLLTTATQNKIGPSPAQVQNMNTDMRHGRLDSTINTSSSNCIQASPRGLLITKPDMPPLHSPILRKAPDIKETPVLTNLLSTPAIEIKAQANQINETLKEPMKGKDTLKDIHLVTKESYQAYKKAQPAIPSGPATATAPMLSKLLEVSTPQPKTMSPTKSPIATPTAIPKKELVSPGKVKISPEKLHLPVRSQSEPEITSTKTGLLTIKVPDDKLLRKSIDSQATCGPPPVKKIMLEMPVGTISSGTAHTSPLKTEDYFEDEQVDRKDSKESLSPLSTARESAPESLMLDLMVKENTANTETCDVMQVDVETGSSSATVTDDTGLYSSPLESNMEGDDEEKQSKKDKIPLTPSMASPASPALSTGSNYDTESAQQQRAWRKSIMLVWKSAASHKYANVFLHPVTDEVAPGYSSIIYRPMDLSLIKKNIETGVIHSTAEFRRDIMLMFQNALMYNRSEHDVYRMAQEMRDDVMEQIQSFINTQLMVQTSDHQSKMLRTKADGAANLGNTRQSNKSSVTFISL